MTPRSLRAAALAPLLFALAACAHHPRDAYTSSSPTLTSAPAFGDPEVAEVTNADLTALSDESLLASGRAEDPRVRRYAQALHADAESMRGDLQRVLARSDVTPEATPTSDEIAQRSRTSQRNLSARQGRDFDRAFLEREIDVQQRLLDRIDVTLLPAASPELRSELLRVRPIVASRLQEARALRQQLVSQP